MRAAPLLSSLVERGQHLQMTATAKSARLRRAPANYTKDSLPKEAIKGTNLVKAK